MKVVAWHVKVGHAPQGCRVVRKTVQERCPAPAQCRTQGQREGRARCRDSRRNADWPDFRLFNPARRALGNVFQIINARNAFQLRDKASSSRAKCSPAVSSQASQQGLGNTAPPGWSPAAAGLPAPALQDGGMEAKQIPWPEGHGKGSKGDKFPSQGRMPPWHSLHPHSQLQGLR